MPVVFVTYSLAYLGRSNFGFGAAAGLARSLNITESRAAFLGSVFFLGYFLFQVPAAAYAVRRSATRLCFSRSSVGESSPGLTGVIRHYWLLVVDRLLLGVAESLILPSMLILLTNWFTRAERSRANAILILGNPVTVTWMAAVTGFLINAVGWQMTFVLEGIPSVIVGVCVAGCGPRPAAPGGWMNSASCHISEAALDSGANCAAADPQTSPRTPRSRCAAPVCAISVLELWCLRPHLWNPEMIRSDTPRGIEAIGLLSAGPFLLAVVLMLVVAWLSDRTHNRKIFLWPFLFLSGIAFFASYACAGQQLLARLCVGHRRRRSHVCALRPVLLHHARDVAAQRCRQGGGAHQQFWRTGWICRHLAGGMAAGDHGKRARRLLLHVDGADPGRSDYAVPAFDAALTASRVNSPSTSRQMPRGFSLFNSSGSAASGKS